MPERFMTKSLHARDLSESTAKARRRLLDLHYKTQQGHLGGNLSCIDSLIVLFEAVLEKNDQFVLSKGHSAGALYIALWMKGRLSENDLQTFAQEGTYLGIHPPVKGLDDVLFGTGSLGHGPSLASGLALGKKLNHVDGRVFCLCGDGEWQEGSCWEALMFAVHQKLDNLTILIDVNGWQGFGATSQVASSNSDILGKRLEAFGAAVRLCDGHNPDALYQALSSSDSSKMPTVILLQTVKCKGVPSLEDTLDSHYLPLTKEQYEQGIYEIEGKNA